MTFIFESLQNYILGSVSLFSVVVECILKYDCHLLLNSNHGCKSIDYLLISFFLNIEILNYLHSHVYMCVWFAFQVTLILWKDPIKSGTVLMICMHKILPPCTQAMNSSTLKL